MLQKFKSAPIESLSNSSLRWQKNPSDKTSQPKGLFTQTMFFSVGCDSRIRHRTKDRIIPIFGYGCCIRHWKHCPCKQTITWGPFTRNASFVPCDQKFCIVRCRIWSDDTSWKASICGVRHKLGRATTKFSVPRHKICFSRLHPLYVTKRVVTRISRHGLGLHFGKKYNCWRCLRTTSKLLLSTVCCKCFFPVFSPTKGAHTDGHYFCSTGFWITKCSFNSLTSEQYGFIVIATFDSPFKVTPLWTERRFRALQIMQNSCHSFFSFNPRSPPVQNCPEKSCFYIVPELFSFWNPSLKNLGCRNMWYKLDESA
jgi:hypothetical protein